MIISASRRTDIPAFYAPWFFNRLQEGYLLVPNPFDPRTLSRISLGRDVVDCIVFWTKNPAPMLPRLGELSGYNYYFQYTQSLRCRPGKAPAAARKADRDLQTPLG